MNVLSMVMVISVGRLSNRKVNTISKALKRVPWQYPESYNKYMKGNVC